MRLLAALDAGASAYPQHTILRDEIKRWTYEEIFTLTGRIANAILSVGLNRDSIVATYSPNHATAFAVQYGILRAGAIWLPVRGRNSPERNIEILREFNVEWVFFHSSFAASLEGIRAVLPRLRGVICLDADTTHSPYLLSWIAPYGTTGSFPQKRPDDVITMYTTSGTTGEPKGVILTNRNWESMIDTFCQYSQYKQQPVHIVTQALTHAAGCFAATLLPLGGTNILLRDSDPISIMEAIQHFRATTIYLPPSLIYAILSHPRRSDFDFSSLEYFYSGSAPISPERLKEAVHAFGPVMAQAYGQVEALMVLTYLSPQDHVVSMMNPDLEHRLSSIGRANPCMQIAIMSETGVLLDAGQKGEIVCQGPLVMAGYYQNDAATAAASAFGWHHTGDIGMIDTDGFVYLVDRKKDVIKVDGSSVFPVEVEQILVTHPSIRNCAVIGIPDDLRGESVMIFLEVTEGEVLSEDDVLQFCKEKLHPIQIPKIISICDHLPRNEAGKVLKRELRAPFWANQSRLI